MPVVRRPRSLLVVAKGGYHRVKLIYAVLPFSIIASNVDDPIGPLSFRRSLPTAIRLLNVDADLILAQWPAYIRISRGRRRLVAEKTADGYEHACVWC